MFCFAKETNVLCTFNKKIEDNEKISFIEFPCVFFYKMHGK